MWRRNIIFPGIVNNHANPGPLPRISHDKNEFSSFFQTLVILDFQSLTTDSNLNLFGLDGTDTQFGMKCSIS